MRLFWSLPTIFLLFALSSMQASCDESTVLFPIKQNGKWGFIDQNGKVKIKAEYDFYDIPSDGLIPVKKNGKWGFIDYAGKVILDFSYEITSQFSEGIGSVGLKGKKAYINKNGKYITDFKFVDALWFHEGRAFVVNDAGVGGFVNNKGELVIPFQYSGNDILNIERTRYPGYGFSEGLCYVYDSLSEKYGYIDRTGKLVIPMKFDDCDSFENGYAVVSIDNKYGIIDKVGNIIIPLIHEGISNFEKIDSRFIATFEKDALFGLLDLKNTIIMKPTYQAIGTFSEGLSMVTLDMKYGYIEQTGKVAIPLEFDDAGNFHEGIAAIGVVSNGKMKYGYIDKIGKFIIKPQFDAADGFSNGIAKITFGSGAIIGKSDRKIGYIDKTGKYIWEPTN